jgi:hypothetical protein
MLFGPTTNAAFCITLSSLDDHAAEQGALTEN